VKRVVIAGLGDSGLLAAIKLAKSAEVVGISAKPGLVSGQELGWRISRPEHWARHNWISFDRYRGLDRVRTVHGALTGVDLANRTVSVQGADGDTSTEPYDALVISTGVTNGFWRQPNVQSAEEIDADLKLTHDQLAAATSVIVVGGGAAAVSSAANIAIAWPDKRVGLYFPGERALTRHHPRAWARVHRRLEEAGVELHPGHRAVVPDGFTGDELTSAPVEWSTGQPPASADAVLWTIGRVRPNTEWLPRDAGATGARTPWRVRARGRRRHRSAAQFGAQQSRRVARQQHPRRVRWQAAAFVPGSEGALGFGDRNPAGRARGVRPQREGIPVPRVVVRECPDAVDRPSRYLSRRARLGL
jgi:NADPH-dependent 2,4-dienoyl-CoA reductase/sulfur reductase-like enzyme